MSEQLSFKISSALKNIIGKELITDDFIAVFELVKNAYDAKSKKVELIFEKSEPLSEDSSIIIIDYGIGMSREDIERKWLLVGYSWKEKQNLDLQTAGKNYRDKIGGERIFAGAKGIGRFSCDRLGSKLALSTKKQEEPYIHVLELDWDKFEENPETNFQTVNVTYYTSKGLDKRFDLKEFESGTVVKISSLRSPWDRDKLLKLKRHLQRLINPAQVSPEEEFQIYIKAEQFLEQDKKEKEDYEIVNGFVKNFVFEKLGIDTTHIDCSIDHEGKTVLIQLLDKGTFIYRVKEKNEYSNLKNVSIKLFFLSPVAKREFTRNMGIEPVRYGSVFFYKNGIKINPCGDEGDDWLGLDRRKTQGTRRNLGNRDVMGRIEVNGYQPYFKEVSSRDGGVVKTPQLEDLKEFFVKKILTRLERYVVEGIGWDSDKKPKDPDQIKVDSFKLITKLVGKAKKSGQELEFNKDLLDIYAKKQIEKTPQLLKNIESLREQIKTKEAKAYINLQTKDVRTAFRNLRRQQTELENEIAKKNLFVVRLGEEKKEIQVLDHQIGLSTAVIRNHLTQLKKRINKGGEIPAAELGSIIDVILIQIEMMESIASFITRENFENVPVWSQEITSDMVEFIKQYVESVYVPIYKETLEREKVHLEVQSRSGIEFTRVFNPFKFRIVIDNLISNARKAGAKHIRITLDTPNDKILEFRIRDDGVGITDEDLRMIFDFGFSKTGGSGMGLYHVKNILEDYGKIAVNNHLDKGVEFIVSVTK